MSHLKERSQKNCLNCNAEVQGRFCHICGQENIETFETAWHLVAHFFKDITHFDGKFFSTLRYLLLKPGFLSREYMIGRRASYLNPIRMYVFTSALFFLIFFSMFSPGENAVVTKTFEGKTKDEILAMDAAAFDGITKKLNDGIPMSRESFITYADSVNRKGGIRLSPTKFASKEAYDSLLRSGKKKHNWIERTLTYKQIEINKKYDNDQQKIVRSFINTLIHSFPQMLFLSLPVFALLLKLLYYRRKEYFYASHAIFSIHLYVFIFIILLIIAALSKANNSLNWAIIDYLSYALLLFFVFYEYKAMRVFYDQNRGKTILKFVILNMLHLFVLVLLFIFFVFFSLMKI